MVQLPGYRRFRAFVEEFKRDFDCIQFQLEPPSRRHQSFPRAITFDALKDNPSQLQVEGSSTNLKLNAESPLSTTTSISNLIAVASVDSRQPMFEVHAQEPGSPASETAASSNPSTSHVALISQANDEAAGDATSVDSCTATMGEAALAEPYQNPPEAEDDTVTASDTSESITEEDSKSKKIPDADSKDTISDDSPKARPRHMTYEFHNCQNVFMNSFNAEGIKVENAGNNTPQVTYNNSPASANTSESASSYHCEVCQYSRYEGVRSGFIRYDFPPMLPPLSFQGSMENLLLYPPGIPPVGPNNSDQFTFVPPASEATIPPRNSKLPVTTNTTSLMQVKDGDANSGSKVFKLPASGHDSKLPPLIINASDHPTHMDFFLPPFSGAAVQNTLGGTADTTISCSRLNSSQSPHHPVRSSPATTSSRDSSDPESTLEQQLELVLETVQKKLQSRIFSPRAQDSLKLINALVAPETPTTSAGTRSTSICESPSLYSCKSESHSA